MTTVFEVMTFGDGDRSGRTLGGALALAIALHVGSAVAMGTRSTDRARWQGPPTEIELEDAPPPPMEEDAPEPTKDEPAEASKPEVLEAPAPRAAAPAPAAARAGAILASNETARASGEEELVSFVTDRAGTSYGSGVVARGGTADFGAPGAKPGGAREPAPGASVAKASAGNADALVPAADLTRPPRLAIEDACKGYFPTIADADDAVVSVVVVVKASGAVTSASIASESPGGQGFGKAARECLLAHRFVPALGRSGDAVATSTLIKVRFAR